MIPDKIGAIHKTNIFKMIDKTIINHNCFISKFQIENNDILGIPIGLHVSVM